LAEETVKRLIKKQYGKKISMSTCTIDKSLAAVKDKTKPLQQHNKIPHEDDPGEIVPAPENRASIFETPDPQPQFSHTISVNSESNEDISADSPQLYAELPQEENTVITVRTRPFNISETNEKTSTIIIMDNNGTAFEQVLLPDNWQVHCFTGGSIQDVLQILQSSEDKLSSVQPIVIGMGVSDKKELNITKLTNCIKNIRKWGYNKMKITAWISIPEFDNLDPQTLSNIKALNKEINDWFLLTDPLNPSEIYIQRGDKHHVHYTPQTAEIILQSIKYTVQLD